MSLRIPIVPASYFGIVLGLSGLGGAWRVAHRVWGLTPAIGETLMAVAIAVWAMLLALFVRKWIVARDDALAEARQPIQCCFIGLVGVSTMLVAIGALPYAHLAGVVVFVAGAAFTIAFAVWRTGLLWRGGRDPATTTPVLYLPTVGAGFVLAIGASALGYPAWGRLAFGAALFAWLAIDSVLLQRLYVVAALPPALRPTLGIQLAPPTVGALAYLAISQGPPDWFLDALIGYGILQALILLRMLPWILEQPFAASYWGFTFGITALGAAPLRAIERGSTGAVAMAAPYLFVGANVAMALIVAATLRLSWRGELLPPAGARSGPETPAPVAIPPTVG